MFSSLWTRLVRKWNKPSRSVADRGSSRLARYVRPAFDTLEDRTMPDGAQLLVIGSVYQNLLQRPPTAVEQAIASTSFQQGESLFQLASTIEATLEYRVDQVGHVFQSLLSRAPSFGEIVGGVNFLSHGGTVEQLDAFVSSTPEFF